MPPIPNNVAPVAKKALSVSIRYQELVSDLKLNYPNHPEGEWKSYLLRNCHNDSLALKSMLIDIYGFKEDEIKIMMDDGSGKYVLPTKDAMIVAMKDLVRGAKAGDHLVFHFSGHGSQIKNYDGSEEDGFDEIIWPSDVKLCIEDKSTGVQSDANDKEDIIKVESYIIDDELKKILVDSLPDGAHLTVLFDCCHSGTAIDLPFNHSDTSRSKLWLTSTPKQSIVAEKPEKHDLNFIMGDNQQVPLVQSPVEEKSFTFPIVDKIRGMSYDAAMAKSRSSSTGSYIVRRNPRELTRVMSLPYAARGNTTSPNDIDKETEIESGVVKNDPEPDYSKHVMSWSACLDEQLAVNCPQGGLLTQSLVNLLREDHNRTHEELLKALSERFYGIARKVRRSWRNSSREDLQKLAEEFVLPVPSIGSVRPVDQSLLEDTFTF